MKNIYIYMSIKMQVLAAKARRLLYRDYTHLVECQMLQSVIILVRARCLYMCF